MSIANPLWGAPRIHGELLRLGVDVGQTSVAKYMVRRRRPPKYIQFVRPYGRCWWRPNYYRGYYGYAYYPRRHYWHRRYW